MSLPSEPATNPDSAIWRTVPLGALDSIRARRLERFALEKATGPLAIEADVDLSRLPAEELFALAVRAHDRQLDTDIVGTLLALSARKGSMLAKFKLAQILAELVGHSLGDSLVDTEAGKARSLAFGVYRELRARIHLADIFGDLEKIRRQFEATADAVSSAMALEEMRKQGVSAGKWKVIAPGARNIRHIDGGDQYRAVCLPMPLWASPVTPDILAASLTLEFPHLQTAAEAIAQVVAGGRAAADRPLLLVGPPGVGKDAIVRRAAELVRRPHAEFDLAGSADSRLLRGTAKGWSTASPSFPISVCVELKCANPVIQLSELDRAGGNRRNGVVAETLLGWCEPSTKKSWLDEGLGSAVDLSDVAFLFTSNGTADTPTALLSRLRVLTVEMPGPDHVRPLLAQALRRRAAALGIRVDDLPAVQPEAVLLLVNLAKRRRLSLRLLDRIVHTLTGSTSRLAVGLIN
jgi:hypothetical protein